jgi:PPOX class probable F420-dependent enzyme
MTVQRSQVADRRALALDAAGVAALLDSERVAVVTSIGPRGWPHAMPMWFVPDGDRMAIWTAAKSQKVRNLERDPRATVLVEAGEAYVDLRGAMIEADVEIEHDPDAIRAFAQRLIARYPELGRGPLGTPDALEAQVRRRVVLRFTPVRTASWDHRKMGDGR